MIATSFALRMFKQMIRSKLTFVLMFIFPLFLLLIFNIAFGGANVSEQTTYRMTIINNDTGIPEDLSETLANPLYGFPQEWLENDIGSNVSQILYNLTYTTENDTENVKIFERVDLSYQGINDAIATQDIHLAVVIPENFSLFILNIINKATTLEGFPPIPDFPTDINETIEIIGDPDFTGFQISSSIVVSVIQGMVDAILGGESVSQRVQVSQEYILPETEEELKIFDFIAPGIYVFGSILSASLFAGWALDDIEKKTIDRMKLSLVTPAQYILGYLLVTFVFVIIQIIMLMLASIWIFGFHPIGSFFQAFWIMLVLSLPTYGLVFTAAGLMKNSDAVGGALGGSSSVLGFASDAFMPMPDVVIVKDILSFTSGSADLLLWDIMPWYHGVNALRAILLYGQSIADVLGDVIMLSIMGIIWFVLGLNIYRKRLYEGGN